MWARGIQSEFKGLEDSEVSVSLRIKEGCHSSGREWNCPSSVLLSIQPSMTGWCPPTLVMVIFFTHSANLNNNLLLPRNILTNRARHDHYQLSRHPLTQPLTQKITSADQKVEPHDEISAWYEEEQISFLSSPSASPMGGHRKKHPVLTKYRVCLLLDWLLPSELLEINVCY